MHLFMAEEDIIEGAKSIQRNSRIEASSQWWQQSSNATHHLTPESAQK